MTSTREVITPYSLHALLLKSISKPINQSIKPSAYLNQAIKRVFFFKSRGEVVVDYLIFSG